MKKTHVLHFAKCFKTVMLPIVVYVLFIICKVSQFIFRLKQGVKINSIFVSDVKKA